MRIYLLIGFFLCAGCSSADRTAGLSSVAAPLAQYAPPASPVAMVAMQAPDFTGQAVLPDNRMGAYTLSKSRGKYVFLLFYPADFSFVCPTEIIAFSDKVEEFDKRNTEVVAISVDTFYTHVAWKNTPRDKGGIENVKITLVSDITKDISRSYGVLHDKSLALRGLFLIDLTGRIRHALINDLAIGRDVDEALRVLDAVQFADTYGELCPASWHTGQKGIKPAP